MVERKNSSQEELNFSFANFPLFLCRPKKVGESRAVKTFHDVRTIYYTEKGTRRRIISLGDGIILVCLAVSPYVSVFAELR